MKLLQKLILSTTITPLMIAPVCCITSCNDPKYKDYSVTCIGDSITWGEVPNSGAMQMSEPFPVALKNKLGLGYANNYGIRYSTVSNGTNGYAPMVDRIVGSGDITQYIPNTAQIIVFWGGINDYLRDCPLGDASSTDTTTYYGALDKVCQLFKNNFSDRFVLFLTPLPCKYDSHIFDLEEVATAINTICADKYGFHVIDLYHDSTFPKYWNAGGCDGIHPTQYYVSNILVPAIADYIHQHFWENK